MFYKSHTKRTLSFTASAVILGAALTACVPASSENAATTAAPAPAPAAAAAAPAAAPKLRVLASYPAGSFLENLEVLPQGDVLITNYFTKTIERVTPAGEKSIFANLSAFPVSLISTADGFLVAAQGKNFLAGDPDFAKAQQILLLDKNGKETGKFNATGAAFLNGMVRLKNGDLLVADSVGAKIWKIDTKAQKITPWFDGQALVAVPGPVPGIPGANGLKLHPKGLLVSNTSQGSLFLIKMDESGNPVGEAELFAKTGIIDDFWVNDDNSVVFTTHTEVLKSIAPDGTISDIIIKGCNGCTAVAPFPLGQSKTFVLINDGGFFFGEKNQSTVALVNVD